MEDNDHRWRGDRNSAGLTPKMAGELASQLTVVGTGFAAYFAKASSFAKATKDFDEGHEGYDGQAGPAIALAAGVARGMRFR